MRRRGGAAAAAAKQRRRRVQAAGAGGGGGRRRRASPPPAVFAKLLALWVQSRSPRLHIIVLAPAYTKTHRAPPRYRAWCDGLGCFLSALLHIDRVLFVLCCILTCGDVRVSGRSRELMQAAKMAVGVGAMPSAATTSTTACSTASTCSDSGAREWPCRARRSATTPSSMAAATSPSVIYGRWRAGRGPRKWVEIQWCRARSSLTFVALLIDNMCHVLCCVVPLTTAIVIWCQ